jgi:hypothetical protein
MRRLWDWLFAPVTVNRLGVIGAAGMFIGIVGEWVVRYG